MLGPPPGGTIGTTGTTRMRTGDLQSGAFLPTSNGSGVLSIDGFQAMGGNYGGEGLALGSVSIASGGRLNLANNIYATNTQIGGRMTVSAAGKSINGAVTNSGVIDFQKRSLAVNGNISGTGALAVTVGSGAAGYIDNSGGTVNYAPGAGTVAVTPTISGTRLGTGSVMTLIRGNSGTAPNFSGTTFSTPSNGLVSWTVTTGSGYAGQKDQNSYSITSNDTVLVASVRDARTIAGMPHHGAVAINGLLAGSSTATDFTNLAGMVQGLSSTEEVVAAGNQLRVAPGAHNAAAAQATGQTIKAVEARAASLRTAQNGGKTGLNSGEALKGLGFWAEGFGSAANQRIRDDTDPYKSYTKGFALGGDGLVTSSLRAGVALSFARTDVDSKGTKQGNTTKTDTYGGTLYATYTGTPWYLDGSFNSSYSENESKRIVSFPGFFATPMADYSSWTHAAKLTGGYPVQVKEYYVIPSMGASYSLGNTASYTETNGNGAETASAEKSSYTLSGNLGAKVVRTFEVDKKWITPEVHFNWNHAFNGTPQMYRWKYAAVSGQDYSTSVVASGANTMTYGAGLVVATADAVTVTGKYDLDKKDKYTAHNGTINVRVDF